MNPTSTTRGVSRWTLRNPEVPLLLLLFVLVNVVTYVVQQPISLNEGRGWDGVAYARVAEQITEHHAVVGEAPYVYRLGTPFLVSVFFGSDVVNGFEVVNVVGNLVSTILLLVWFRLFLQDARIRLVLVALYVLTWHAPTRFTYHYPVYVDPWLFAFLIAGLIAMEKCLQAMTLVRVGILALLVLVGVVFREAVLVIALGFLVSANPHVVTDLRPSALATFRLRRFTAAISRVSFVPLILGMAGMFLVFRIASKDSGKSFVSTALDWAYLKQLPAYVHAWFIAFGTMIVVPIRSWRKLSGFLAAHPYMVVHVAAFSVLAWIGGTDTERILFWSMPVIYLLVGKALEVDAKPYRSVPFLSVLVLVQAISARVFWTTPDFPNAYTTPIPVLTPLTSKCQHLDLWTHHGSRVFQEISLFEYLAVASGLLYWANVRAARSQGVPGRTST